MRHDSFKPINDGDGYSVVTSFLHNPLDALMLKTMRLPADTKTTGLSLEDAKALTEQVNAWIESHTPKKGGRR